LRMSVATGIRYRNVAGFPAFRAIVQTIRAEAHRVLALADGTVFFASAIGLELAALHAHRRFGHVSPPADCTRAQEWHQGADEQRAAVRLPVFSLRLLALKDFFCALVPHCRGCRKAYRHELPVPPKSNAGQL
jgi:hypothetical protein